MNSIFLYRCLHGQAPRYLPDNLIPASDAARRRLRLRSANRNCLTVSRCRLSTYGCRAFDYAGPTVWNWLPDELRNSDSFDNFQRFMKTILFSRYKCVQRIRGYFITRSTFYLLTYLLTLLTTVSRPPIYTPTLSPQTPHHL